jgi:hypothetical protein
MSGGVPLDWLSISIVMAGIVTPVPFKHQLVPAVLTRCKSVLDVNTGATFWD